MEGKRWVNLVGATVGVLLIVPAAAPAQDAQVTFAKDVAPIIQAKCENCHRPGTSAPMALRTYDEVRPWAPLIKDRVMKRVMPPWPLDKSIGIQEFKNDISLTDEQIATIANWVDAGAPMGNPADLPAPVQWPDPNRWAFEDFFGRPPDLVVASPAYTVVANGLDQWPNPETKVEGLTTERYIRAVGVRPGTPESRYVFHHANPSLIQPGDDPEDVERGQLVQSAVGTAGYIYPEDAGKLIKPGSSVSFGMHFYPTTEDVDAVMEVGLWFHPEGVVPAHITQGEQQINISQETSTGDSPLRLDQRERSGNRQLNTSWPDLLIPPHSIMTMRGIHTLDRNIRVHSLRGHMHFRGKYQTVEVIYPDGRWEVLNKMNWDHGWHTAFLYEDHVMPLLPKGTIVLLTSVYDNTSNNRYNPDPSQWVAAGDRSVDEMSHLRFGLTYLDDEDFAAAVAERERVLAERERQRLQQADSDK
jgi:hypothetical protein